MGVANDRTAQRPDGEKLAAKARKKTDGLSYPYPEDWKLAKTHAQTAGPCHSKRLKWLNI
jgi:hypothetical protein